MDGAATRAHVVASAIVEGRIILLAGSMPRRNRAPTEGEAWRRERRAVDGRSERRRRRRVREAAGGDLWASCLADTHMQTRASGVARRLASAPRGSGRRHSDRDCAQPCAHGQRAPRRPARRGDRRLEQPDVGAAPVAARRAHPMRVDNCADRLAWSPRADRIRRSEALLASANIHRPPSRARQPPAPYRMTSSRDGRRAERTWAAARA